MSFNYISKISIYLSFLFIFSCQSELLSLKKNNQNDIITSNQVDNNNQIEVIIPSFSCHCAVSFEYE